MTDNTEQRTLSSQRISSASTVTAPVLVKSRNVRYDGDEILARYRYERTTTEIRADGSVIATPLTRYYRFKTGTKPRKLGLLQVGWGGNNGSTVTGAIFANRHNISWQTRDAVHIPNYNGSLTQATTLRLGFDVNTGKDIFAPFGSLIPMAAPEDITLGGWDISGLNMADSMDRAQVLEPDLRRQLRPHLEGITPLPGAFDENFIAKNQQARATNVIESRDKGVQLDRLRKDIREFKERHSLEFVVVIWTANSEKYAEESRGVNDTAENLLDSISKSHAEVSPSTLYGVAAVLEGCPYVNGSPQNTFVPGLVELAVREKVMICGDDFKSGQTKMKSVLADYLIGCGIKIRTMVTYNHLGNNDMYQLTDEVMWKPKSASKSRVIEDIVDSNGMLYQAGEAPDHVVVVKYVPYLNDSKRDVSEYTSETFMNCPYTTIMHNTCLDSALCAPLIIDLAILAELFGRVEYAVETEQEEENDLGGKQKEWDEYEYESMEVCLSVLGFYMKIPRTPANEPIVNALGRQKGCIENMLRALVGLPAENDLLLESKFPGQTK